MNRQAAKRPVVVAVAEDQPDLLTYATGMSEILDAPLRVVHSESVRITSADFYAGRRAGEIMRSAGKRVLDEARGRLGTQAGTPVEYVLHSVPAAHAVGIESKHAALVVLGADEVNMLERLAGLDVARRIALHGSCPVVVVPSGTSAPRLTQIVVGIDIDNTVEDALGFAFGMADRTGAKVRAVTVVPENRGAEERAWYERRLRGHVRHWLTAFPSVDVRTELLVGSAHLELTRAAHHAELVVVGHPNQPHPSPFFSRPVAAAVLRSATFAVAVVPEGHDSRP